MYSYNTRTGAVRAQQKKDGRHLGHYHFARHSTNSAWHSAICTQHVYLQNPNHIPCRQYLLRFVIVLRLAICECTAKLFFRRLRSLSENWQASSRDKMF